MKARHCEIVRPGTATPVPEGEVGELVITTLNPDYPLIVSHWRPVLPTTHPKCPTGRTNTRIKAGWAGPTRPLRCAGISCTPAAEGRHCQAAARVRRAAAVGSGEMANDQMVRCGWKPPERPRPGPPVGRRHSRSDQAARRVEGRPGTPAQRWQD